jgi:hypothetical protein
MENERDPTGMGHIKSNCYLISNELQSFRAQTMLVMDHARNASRRLACRRFFPHRARALAAMASIALAS